MNLTQILHKANTGDSDARADLLRVAYNELYRLATARMQDERLDHTLTSTALVGEVSVKLLQSEKLPSNNRGQFLAYVAKAMRSVLIDHARSRGSQKRVGNRQRFELNEAIVACQDQRDDFLALNDALDRLAQIDERKSKVVEMRYFGGLSIAEVAQALDVSVATVNRDWEIARTLLMNDMMTQDG